MSKLKPIGRNARSRQCLLSNQTITKLKKVASNAAINNGFEIINLEVFTRSNPLSIQVNIRHQDHEKDVTIDDCSSLSQPLGEAIENSSILNQPFTLEISSEGIGDILSKDRDFKTFKGFPIEVTYQDSKKIEHHTKGLLLGKSDNDLQINQKGKIYRIPERDVISVRLTTSSG